MKHQMANPLRAGQEALARGEWEKARAAFHEALKLKETAEAFEGLSWACWWLNEANVMFDARERAYHLYRKKGDRGAAARMAIWIASDYVEFRAQMAIANGWRKRARRLLEGLDPIPEHGWLILHEGVVAIEINHDTDTARRLGVEVAEWGRRLNVVDLEALGLTMQGLALVGEGRVDEGMSLLDEAMAAAVAGELEEPLTMGWVTCYLVYACELMRDFDRAAQWCQKLEEIARGLRFRFWLGICRIHYAGVLMWCGKWHEAEAELADSAREIETTRPPYMAEAIVRLAELRRRQGRLDEASELFSQAEEHPLALLGSAELALERGAPKQAEDLLQRHLRQLPEKNKALRAPALELLVRTYVALGDDVRRAAALEALHAIAVSMAALPFRASAAFAQGIVAVTVADYQTAHYQFEDAIHLFHRAGAPYEAGRARIELANVLFALGRINAAQKEARAALESLQRIGALREAERAATLLQQLEKSTLEPVSIITTSPLTRREVEVLRFVALGFSDREIATRLAISEHTVHRHISNIRTKLDVPSRAAAVAFASRHSVI